MDNQLIKYLYFHKDGHKYLLIPYSQITLQEFVCLKDAVCDADEQLVRVSLGRF